MIEENIQITFKSPVLLVENVQKSNEFYCNILQQEVESDFGENIGFKSGLALWEKTMP